ncbi:hypothetical protein CDAR_390421 [Caerostris darwini]|uniref:Uncharacterized protein n=1 Tax=Caerostris darwini TaxID=1538125 RepID=A0AAV4NXK9_9ARAC|nr:hypothetical protein CDAR_390421 [Caerostris darwini]
MKLRHEADVCDKRKKFGEEQASPSKLLIEPISERLTASKTFVPSLLDCRQDKLEVVSSCLRVSCTLSQVGLTLNRRLKTDCFKPICLISAYLDARKSPGRYHRSTHT